MLGRDRLAEKGTPSNPSPAINMSSHENELMGQATQCVRKFAPNGRSSMRGKGRNGHITACKISDANPNEMIASWSGDYIYSFDLVRSPDAREYEDHDGDSQLKGKDKGKSKESSDRKRKGTKAGSSTSAKGPRKGSKPRAGTKHGADAGDLSLRVRYENGQTQDMPVRESSNVPPATLEEPRESHFNESQKRSMQIARSVVKIRKLLFSLDASTRTSSHAPSRLSAHTPSLTAALGLAASCLPEMDEIIRSWGYPMNPDEEDIALQQTLRANRDSSRRFVQAAGTLSRVLGGRLQTASAASSPILQAFEEISPAPREGPHSSLREVFNYDFLRAVTLWLEGGQQALLQGFKRSPTRRHNQRFPMPENPKLSDIDDHLIPYLLRLARETPVPNVDASRFEVDERRMTFQSESAAVIAFSNAIRMPLEDLSRAIMPTTLPDVEISTAGGPRQLPAAQDRSTALMFWGFKVGRALLLKAGEGINFQFVDTAFGGLCELGDTAFGSPFMGGSDEDRVQEDIDPNELEDVVDTVTLVKRSSGPRTAETTANPNSTQNPVTSTMTSELVDEESDVEMREATPAIENEDADSGSEVILMEDLQNDIYDHLAAYDETEANGDEEPEDEDDDEDGVSEGDGDITAEESQFMFQSAYDRSKRRESVEADVPYSTHTRQYRGHCNVRTVKDCNFFGLQDEYVVSGSDSGHLFIWVSCVGLAIAQLQLAYLI